MIQITLVPINAMPVIWPKVSAMLEAALVYSGGRFTIDDLLNEIMISKKTLWIALDDDDIIGCTTVSIFQYPQLKALCYDDLGGRDVHLWLDEGHRVLSNYGRDMGCTRLECQGRSGWKKFLEALGYKQYAVRYEMEL